ncbi:MAG: aspartyl protease family protein [Moheibacter sp.]
MLIRKFFKLILLLCISVCGQETLIDGGKKKFNLDFKYASGFVIIPVSVNGSQPLDFLLDTGSPYTIITNLDAFKYLQLKKGEQISIWGLGKDREKLEAYRSKDNSIGFGKAVIRPADVILLYEDIDLGSRFGIPVFGIVGYDVFKDLVVKVNYSRKRITFYRHENFYKKFNSSGFSELDMEVSGNKPYLKLNSTINDQPALLRLLIDSAGTDALWLFEKDEQQIYPKPPFIEDYLGFGLNGEIYGKRARIQNLELGSYHIRKPTVSFPDSLSVSYVTRTGRSGSVGAEILRRFTTVYDYKNSKLFVKKNKYFKDEFYYNLAGLELYQPYPELPYLEVSYVRKDSPADRAGLEKGDAVRFINEKKIGLFGDNNKKGDQTAVKTDKINFDIREREVISLVEINETFRKHPGTKIVIVYTRGDSQLQRTAEFILESAF